ncbi:hypothetical protein HanRHA438_Chr08g0343721 [Helianthus annuus]|nr:hypothetical protein HanRHA438_Chr08g0343721 [Helianthus annuus]
MFTSSVGMGENFKNFFFQKCLVFKAISKAQITKSTRDVTNHLVFCHGQVQINKHIGYLVGGYLRIIRLRN